jgi:hypothetical protein
VTHQRDEQGLDASERPVSGVCNMPVIPKAMEGKRETVDPALIAALRVCACIDSTTSADTSAEGQGTVVHAVGRVV